MSLNASKPCDQSQSPSRPLKRKKRPAKEAPLSTTNTHARKARKLAETSSQERTSSDQAIATPSAFSITPLTQTNLNRLIDATSHHSHTPAARKAPRSLSTASSLPSNTRSPQSECPDRQREGPIEMPRGQRTPASSVSSSSTSWSDNVEALKAYRMFIDRHKKMPQDLQELLQTINVHREGQASPDTKRVQRLVAGLQEASEARIKNTVSDVLIYKCEVFPDDEGEGKVISEYDRQWPRNPPRPDSNHTSLTPAEFEDSFNKVNAPSKPKPDLIYGYSDDAFTNDLASHRRRLGSEALLNNQAPWFPYFLVEWKSNKDPIYLAELQARRDGAVACKALHDLYAASVTRPSASSTCVFSLCVDPKQAAYRVHWRNEDPDGGISWEADVLSQAFLNNNDQIYQLRGRILKTLAWARRARFQAISQAIMNYPIPSNTLKKFPICVSESSELDSSDTRHNNTTHSSPGAFCFARYSSNVLYI